MDERHQADTERRYDAEALRRVAVVAEQRQREYRERLSASDIVAIGAEAGLEPRFLREAMAIVDAEDALPVPPRRKSRLGRRAWAVPPVWAAFSYIMPERIWETALVPLFPLLWMFGLPAGLALALGAAARDERRGFLLGAATFAAGWSALMLRFGVTPDVAPHILAILLVGSTVAGGLGTLGAVLRRRLTGGTKSLPAVQHNQPGLT